MEKLHSLAAHMQDVLSWWYTHHQGYSERDAEWMRNIAYERWTNNKPLLSAEDKTEGVRYVVNYLP